MENKKNFAGFIVDFYLISLFYFMLPLGPWGAWALLFGTIWSRFYWGFTTRRPANLIFLSVNLSALTLVILLILHIVFNHQVAGNYPIILNEEIPTSILCLILIFSIERITADDLIYSIHRRYWLFFIVGGTLTLLATAFFFFPDLKLTFSELLKSRPVQTEIISLRADYNMFATGISIALIVCIYANLCKNRKWFSFLLIVVLVVTVFFTGSRRLIPAGFVVIILLLIIHPMLSLPRAPTDHRVDNHQTPHNITPCARGLFLCIVVFSLGIITFTCLYSAIKNEHRKRIYDTFTNISLLETSVGRDGLVQWGLSRLEENNISEWVFGSGMEYMQDLKHSQELPNTLKGHSPYYIHNPILGTVLMFGGVGLLSMMLLIVLPIFSLIRTKDRFLISFMFPILIVLGARSMMSGNTILSAPVFCASLLVAVSMVNNNQSHKTRRFF